MAAAKISTEPKTLKQKMMHMAFPAFVVACVLGGLALVVQSSTSGGVYDMTIAELMADDVKVGKGVRVNGIVQAGSFRELPGDKINIEFTIGDSEGNTLQVRYHQLLPDAFAEGRQVIVQGKLTSKNEILCDRLTVKCPSKYKDENSVGADTPYGKKPGGNNAPLEAQ